MMQLDNACLDALENYIIWLCMYKFFCNAVKSLKFLQMNLTCIATMQYNGTLGGLL